MEKQEAGYHIDNSIDVAHELVDVYHKDDVDGFFGHLFSQVSQGFISWKNSEVYIFTTQKQVIILKVFLVSIKLLVD